MKINTHISSQAFSLKIKWNVQLRHEPPVASECPLGSANMESQVTILATLPRSDTIQTKLLHVLCWPERAFTSPTATRTRRFQGRHLGAHEIPSEEQRPSGQLQHEDRTSCKPHSGALGTGNLHQKQRLSCRVSVTSRDFWSPAFGSLSACVLLYRLSIQCPSNQRGRGGSAAEWYSKLPTWAFL